jgi:electron transfer flavoprotein alpha subunit
VAEHDGKVLNPSTARCVACAASVPEPHITVLVCAASAGAIARSAAQLTGVEKVLTIEDPRYEHLLAATVAPQLIALSPGYTHVFGPSTTFGKDLMPRVAAALGVPQVSDVMRVEGEKTFLRPIYAGNAIVTVEVASPGPVVATVRMASYRPVESDGNTAAIESAATNVTLPEHTRFVSVSAPKSDRPDLQTAARVVSGGRALGSAENFAILLSLAQRLRAAVGASRAAVDAGFAPSELQVGQTGKIIAPELYLAIGISGAIQHLTGIKDARTIVAINKDAEAPIFEIADIGLVGDLFQIVPELEKLVSAG